MRAEKLYLYVAMVDTAGRKFEVAALLPRERRIV